MHRPPLQILLPSYGDSTSFAAEALAAADRLDPKARAQRKHQQQVSHSLHSARSSDNTMGKTAREQAKAAATAGSTGLHSNSGVYTVPSMPLTYRSSYDYDNMVSMNGSMSARLPPTRNPYQQQLHQQQQQVRATLGRSWDSATSGRSLRVSGSTSRKLRPLAPPVVASETLVISSSSDEAPADEPTSNSNSSSLSSGLPMPLPLQQTGQPGPMQQSLYDSFAATTAAATTAAAGAQTQRAFPLQPSAPQTARGASSTTSPSRTFTSSGELKFVPILPPSFHVTLPKNSSYCDHAQTHRTQQNLNDYASAGFSISEKLKSRGIPVHYVPMLG